MPKRLTPRGQAAPPVDPNIAGASIPKEPAKKRSAPKKVAGPGIKYVYNLRAIECRFTLTTNREIRLQPRGQRGDLDVVNKDEQLDPIFLANKDLLFSLIEPEAAHEIISNQQINDSRQGRPIFEQLLNERGESYDQRDVRVEAPQSIQVGRVESTGDGRNTEKNVGIGRVGPVGPQITEAPGSPGHPATAAMLESVPGEISPEDYHEFLLWKQFRAAMEAQPTPDEIRDSLNVTVEPLQLEDELEGS